MAANREGDEQDRQDPVEHREDNFAERKKGIEVVAKCRQPLLTTSETIRRNPKTTTKPKLAAGARISLETVVPLG
jgi:hypothetical protein